MSPKCSRLAGQVVSLKRTIRGFPEIVRRNTTRCRAGVLHVGGIDESGGEKAKKV